jgi:predicted TPR repeat methyltransferase
MTKRSILAEAWFGRGRALQRLQRAEEAVAAYRQALAHGGDAEIVLYHLASLGAAPPPAAAPRQLVARVFDQYADHYDEHLLGPLKYHTPGLLFDAVVRSLPARSDLEVLDLGCGTGLMGARLRALARTLIGVDLSSRMLKVAQQRQVYDDLVCSELTEYLRTRSQAFDLVIASDVLVYFGDLAEVFGAVRGTLTEGGLFGFSVEAGESRAFELKPTRRYAHSGAYLRQVAQDQGFVAETIESKVTREEDGKELMGYLAVLRAPKRPSAPEKNNVRDFEAARR